MLIELILEFLALLASLIAKLIVIVCWCLAWPFHAAAECFRERRGEKA
jgi:hypothetical protein